jgi:hypothetical protein
MLTTYLNPQNNWKREELPKGVAEKVAAFCKSNNAHPYHVDPVKLDNGLSGWRLFYAKNYLTKKHNEHYTYFYN